MTAQVSILGKQQYDQKELLDIFKFLESSAGEKLIADLQQMIDANNATMSNCMHQLSHSSSKLNGLVEKIASCRETNRVICMIKDRIFSSEYLNRKYNDVIEQGQGQ